MIADYKGSIKCQLTGWGTPTRAVTESETRHAKRLKSQAMFCMNKCPHKDCNGCCDEYREFCRNYKGDE